MRYPATEKLEIIRLVERSHLPVRHTLRHLGVPKTSFYRWYDRYQSIGEQGLEDRHHVLRAVRDQLFHYRLNNRMLSSFHCSSPWLIGLFHGIPK